MEKIKLIDSTNKIPAGIDESKLSILGYVLNFQHQTSIEELLRCYLECLNSIHNIEGIRYRFPLLNISHRIGIESRPQCHIQMETNDDFLGDLTIYHHSFINKSTLKHIELITSLLTHPLRAIIQENASASIALGDEPIGLANKTLIDQLVSREAKLAYRERVPMSLILFDIDRFKTITQRSDLITRDKILYKVMKVIRRNIRDTDLLLRYESDIYCLILKGVAPENALLISERVRQAVDLFKFFIHDEKPSHITISAGIAELVSTDSIDSIFSRATNAVQYAKKMGRNQSTLADGIFIS